MMLPKQFDLNEWFLAITLLIGYGLVFKLPKRFPTSVTIMILTFCLFLSITADEMLAAPPFDFYDLNDTRYVEIADLLMWFVYSPFGYFFIYIYDRYRIKGISILAYIGAWSLFSLGFEWLGSTAGLFHYKNWSILNSFHIYTVLCGVTLVYFRLIQHYFGKTKKRAISSSNIEPN